MHVILSALTPFVTYQPASHPLDTSYLMFFAIIWTVYIVMKIMRPSEFIESVRKPHIYYRMYSGRASRYLEDFKILGFINIFLTSMIFFTFILNVNDWKSRGIVAVWWFMIALYNFLLNKILVLWNPSFRFLYFIKGIYAHYAAFGLSFVFFVILFSNIDAHIKKNLLIITVLYFYYRYVSVVFKLKEEWNIKAFHIILYLCTTEIIPVSVLIYSISRLI